VPNAHNWASRLRRLLLLVYYYNFNTRKGEKIEIDKQKMNEKKKQLRRGGKTEKCDLVDKIVI